MRRRTSELLVLLLAGLCVLVARPAKADDDGAPFDKKTCVDLLTLAGEMQANSERAARIHEQERTRTPLGASAVSPALRTEASFSAGNENGRAYLSLANKADLMSERVFALKISVPFDKDKDEGVFASRAGVSGDIVLTASTSKYHWTLNTRAYAEELCSQCEARGLGIADCYPENDALVDPLDSAETSDQLQQDFLDILFGKVAAVGWSLEAEAGRKKRSYFDADGSENDDDRAALSLSGTLAFHLDTASVFAKLTAKRDYKEMNKAQRCSPIEDTMDLESCKQLPFGRAEEVEGLVASLQGVQELKDYAVAPTVQYDFEETAWTVVLPIYLIWQPADKEAKADEGPRQWIGGLKLAWTSDGDDDFGAAIFVSTPLKW